MNAPASITNPEHSLESPVGRPMRVKPAGFLLLLLAVVWPAAVVLFETFSGFCAGVFFDPIPTLGHFMLLMAVPGVNLALWTATRFAEPPRWARALPWLVGVTLVITLYYSLIFVPMAPLAVMALAAYGLGLLPLTPFITLVGSLWLRARLARRHGVAADRRTWIMGLTAGLALLAWAELPTLATHVGSRWVVAADRNDPEDWRRSGGLWLLRHLGNRDLLAEMGHRPVMAPWDTLALFIGDGPRNPDLRDLRRVWFEVTGEPFSAQTPAAQRLFDWDWDVDLAATQAGAQIAHLGLGETRLDGAVSVDSGLAYLEWTLVFTNQSRFAQEARALIALPTGAVVSRATLWVHGQPEEAVIAARGQAQAAYQNVVQVRRDPLLVTTAGPDRVFIQAFPVPAGGEQRLKLGITAPLDLATAETGYLQLPRLIDANFNLGEAAAETVWISAPTHGLGRVAGGGESGSALTVEDAGRRVVGTRKVSPSAVLRVDRSGAPDMVVRADTLEAQPPVSVVRQSLIETVPAETTDHLTLVVDGSAALAEAAPALDAFLEALPDGLPVALIKATDRAPLSLAAAPLTPAYRTALRDGLRADGFIGGRNNVEALAQAVRQAGGIEPALIWVHGPQPFNETGSLAQALERQDRPVRLVSVAVAPGPNRLLKQLDLYPTARTLSRRAGLSEDLQRLAGELTGSRAVWQRHFTVVAVETSTETGASVAGAELEGSAHILRLAALDRVHTLIGWNDTERAVAEAIRYRLVTPVSGAVVLESAQQYENAGLEPPDDMLEVPTIPEPEHWAMLILALAVVGWMVWRRRRDGNVLPGAGPTGPV